MPTPNIETARGWLGRVMVDRDSNKIGEIVDIYLDHETGQPEWAVVRTGLFGMRSSFVPLAEAREIGDELQVPHQRGQVKEAPSIEPDGQLSEVEEAELYRHYGLDYDTVTLGSDSPANQTDTGMDAGPGTPAPVTGSRGLDTEPDTSFVESEQGRRGPGDEPAVGAGEPVAPAGQDQLPVGEGISRPFVYETPGRPESGAGTRRRQPGQVRLRRYLVTEVVTETEAGQRHEVRVQSEPVSDADVDAVLTPPNQQDEPNGQESNAPRRSDWFSGEDDPRQ